MDRRVAAVVLVALGVAVNWGIGWGLIAAGAGVGTVTVEVPDWRPVFARARLRGRAVIARMDDDPVPRRATAGLLVAVGLGALIATGIAFAGAAGGLAAGAVGGIGTGAALGHE